MESRYSLRLYDTELMRFVMEKRGLAGLVAGIVSINEAQAPPAASGYGAQRRRNHSLAESGG